MKTRSPGGLLLWSLLALCVNVPGHAQQITVGDLTLSHAWQIQSSSQVQQPDSLLSTSLAQTEGWYAGTVPGTVLASLVQDGVYPHPFQGRNLVNIPTAPFAVPWWYRTEFDLSGISRGQQYQLLFQGINYRADIWLNGHQIASMDTLEGSFRMFRLDVSPWVHAGTNILAVKVRGPIQGDLAPGFVDWNPEAPDHNLGIWRPVHLLASGPVSLSDPYVRNHLDSPTYDVARLSIRVRATNLSAAAQDGILEATLSNGSQLRKRIHLAAHRSEVIRLSSGEFPALVMRHPKLWWTYNLGTPYLYHLHLRFVQNSAVSDTLGLAFGVRSVRGYRTPEGYRGYTLNGRKVLIRGGGWTDPMLMNASQAYEKAGIDYAVHMHLNALRMEGFWGKNDHLYRLCDEKGLLLMAGFSCQWEWTGYMGVKADQYGAIKTPQQIELAAKSWKDQVLWLRNHPSLFLWLYGSDKWPRPALEERYLNVLDSLDPSRPYVQSAAEHVSALTGYTGMKMRGPYDYVPPDYWYVDRLFGGAFGFNTETSPGPEIPVLESLRKMIPADSLWPIGSAWLFHAARGNFHNLTRYNEAMDHRLGAPQNLEDYERKAQYLNYEGMRAMFEAFESNRGRATGIIQWMYNASWPKLWWQLYDYYLMPTAAFYGAREAGAPLHLSYNYKTQAVELLNNGRSHSGALQVHIQVLDPQLKTLWDTSLVVSCSKSLSSVPLVALAGRFTPSRLYFVSLILNDGSRLVDRNFYALSSVPDLLDEAHSTWFTTPESQYSDLSGLQQLPDQEVQATFEKTSQTNGESWYKASVYNPGPHLAFMVHLDLIDQRSSHSVTPVFWQDNYISLLPGEHRTLWVHCHSSDLHGHPAALRMDGWNLPQTPVITPKS